MSQKKPQRQMLKQKQAKRSWPLWLALGGALLVAMAAFALSRSAPAPKAAVEVTGAPRLKVEKEKVDLGNIKLGQTVDVSFQIANVGDQPLRFTESPYVEVAEGC